MLHWSIQGMMKNRPGPTAPPCQHCVRWGYNKEHYLLDSAKPENNCSFVFLNHFDTEKHRDGEGAHHEEDGDDGQDNGSAAATDISVSSGVIRVSFRYNIVTLHDGNNLNKNAIS